METGEQKRFQITLETLVKCMKPIMPLLQDTNVFEVYLNADGNVWTDTFDRGRVKSGVRLLPAQAEQLIKNVAALNGKLIPRDAPMLDADLPDTKYFEKARFQGNLPAIVSAPTFNIRKLPNSIFTLDDYVEHGSMTAGQRQAILDAIHAHKNILAAGGTKSGKTTLLNALLEEISKLNERVILLEDTPELRCTAEDCVSLRTTRTVAMDDLLKAVLRMTPDRIVVGEVRREEALTLIDAWSTGHSGGCSTVHSNSAVDTLLRLEGMIGKVSARPQQASIAQAVDVIIYLKYLGQRRMIEEIIELDHYDSDKKEYVYRKIG